MKRCASCAHCYAEEKTACPRCWYTGWTRVDDCGQGPLPPENPYACEACQYVAAAGTARCPHCGRPMRPRWLTLIGGVLLIGGPLAGLAFLALACFGGNYWWLSELPWIAVGAWLGLGLLRGRYAAWQRVRWLLLSNLGLLLALFVTTLVLGSRAGHAAAASMDLAATFIGVLLIQGVLTALVWIYLHSDRVQAYCAVDKPFESSEIEVHNRYSKWTS